MNPVITPVSETLTPNQKRLLLFNIGEPLNIPLQEFDDDWWPLVSNVWTVFSHGNLVNGDSWKVFTCRFAKSSPSSSRQEGIPQEKRRKTKIRPAGLCSARIKVTRYPLKQKIKVERFKDSPDHDHSLEESEKLKRPQAVRALVELEAIKNYRPPEITKAVKEYAAEKLGLEESVKELKRKEVSNIKSKVYGSLNTHLIGNQKHELDIREAVAFLENKEYKVERFKLTSQSTQGLVFIHPNQIDNLERYGWLTLIDSTHKTNRYDYRLFTLYVRNIYGCWNVGAHFFVSSEDSSTVAEALKIIRRFARQWVPRYFISDQSHVETKSIKIAFPGLQNGEQECSVIYCTVHIMRTWMGKIYDSKTRQKMLQAMHKRTKPGCENLIQEAIKECLVPDIKRYIQRNYLKNTDQWALCARQHSPLLLQVTTTNPLESYHSELKRTTTPHYGLIGSCHKIVELDKKKCLDSENVAFEFRIKKISVFGVDSDMLSEIHKLPYPIQQLIINELCAVEGRIEKGKATPGLISLSCECLFFCRYLLPCRHIFHEHMHGSTRLLTNEAWLRFQQMFEEAGFDIYTRRELIEVRRPQKTEVEKAAESRRLAVNELIERIRDVYWRVEEEGNSAQTNTFVRELNAHVGPVLNNQNNRMLV